MNLPAPHVAAGLGRLGVLALLAAPVRSLGAQAARPALRPPGTSGRAVTVTSLEQRIRATAERFRGYAAVPRFVLLTVAFPKDSAEYTAMNGYALLILTALVQHAVELPVRRVVVRSPGRETELDQVTWVESDETATDSLAARTLGRHREDALYLLPIALCREPGAVVIDLAAERRDLVVSQFDRLPDEAAALPVAAPTAPRPPEAALLTMLAREYPGFVQP